MTREEKYVMERTAICLALYATDYQSLSLVQWVLDNTKYKKLNEEMGRLITESHEGKDTSGQIQKVYEEKLEVSAEMLNIQAELQFPEEFVGKKSKTEEYVFMQMHIRLASIAPEKEEPEILLEWAAANYKLKKTNKQLGVLYAKGKKSGFQNVAEEYNKAKELKGQYTKERDAAVSRLEEFARKDGRSYWKEIPLKKKKAR